jgi:hypothetical protein
VREHTVFRARYQLMPCCFKQLGARLLSPLARREDAAGIEIEENLMEALTREPFA